MQKRTVLKFKNYIYQLRVEYFDAILLTIALEIKMFVGETFFCSSYHNNNLSLSTVNYFDPMDI